MCFPEGGVQVHVYGQPVDMRKSFLGLYALTRPTLGRDPLSGDLYVYINRRGNYLKCLYWDRTGFCIWAKKLERGCFVADWSRAVDQRLDITGLKLLLEGIEPGRYRRRYKRQNEAVKSR